MKKALGAAYLKAACEAKEILRAQAHILIGDTAEFERFEQLLEASRAQLEKLKLAYAAHIRDHRC